MNILVVCKYDQNSPEGSACKLITRKGVNVKYSWKNVLTPRELEGVDVVVSIGGDGTALSASHYLNWKPLLAVNSDPKKSEGALTTISIDELDKKIDSIIEGKFKTEKLERIEVCINGKAQAPLALNEVFIANEKAYLISKYELRFNGSMEVQRSSGLIFSTGTGSTAWFKSAGGKPFSPQSRFIRMIVREPYIRNLLKFSMLYKKISHEEKIEIKAMTPMILAIDSIREVLLKEEDVVSIRVSDKPLMRII